MSYYKKFEILSHSVFWRKYLRWAYTKCVDDLVKLGRTSNMQKDGFTCLLCGVSGEITADEFIKFVINRNPKAKIIIIDYADEQVNAVANLVNKRFSKVNITVKEANALDLDFIHNNSVDWIETDGFLEYFDNKDLEILISEWRRILSRDGFITTREFVGSGAFGALADKVRLWIGKNYLGVTFHRHTRKQLEDVFNTNDVQFVTGLSPFPTYRRYTLAK